MENELYDESVIIDFDLPDYLITAINELIEERKKEKSLSVDLYECDLIAEINRAFYSNLINESQANLLRKKYLWW